MTRSTTIDVLIVGAGPTGSVLAVDLARRGVKVRLVDRATRVFEGSRAKGVQPRTLEIFEDLGVLPDVLDAGSPYPKMGIHLGPITIPWRMIAKGRPRPDVPYPDTWLIPQSSTLRALHIRFEALGGSIGLGTELTEFAASVDGVTADVVTPSGPEQISPLHVGSRRSGRSSGAPRFGFAYWLPTRVGAHPSASARPD